MFPYSQMLCCSCRLFTLTHQCKTAFVFHHVDALDVISEYYLCTLFLHLFSSSLTVSAWEKIDFQSCRSTTFLGVLCGFSLAAPEKISVRSKCSTMKWNLLGASYLCMHCLTSAFGLFLILTACLSEGKSQWWLKEKLWLLVGNKTRTGLSCIKFTHFVNTSIHLSHFTLKGELQLIKHMQQKHISMQQAGYVKNSTP